MVNTMDIKKVEDRSFSDSHYVTEFVSPQTGIKYYASVANLETAIYKDGEPLRKPELMIFAQKGRNKYDMGNPVYESYPEESSAGSLVQGILEFSLQEKKYLDSYAKYKARKH
jgi:hypothetical protein